jgi:hypothetical protein
MREPWVAKAVDWTFWTKIGRALQRMAGMGILIGAHVGLERALGLAFNSHSSVVQLVETFTLGIFILVYATLSFEVAELFIPRLGHISKFWTADGVNDESEHEYADG